MITAVECPGMPPAFDVPAGGGGNNITNISNIDLLEDQFSVEMLLWTTWGGDPQADPSDDSERDL